MEGKPSKIFIYSTLTPILWLSFSFLLLAIAPEAELGIAGIVVTVNLSLLIVCWHFSKSFKRHFSKNEKLRLFVYSFLWMACIRALSLYGISEELTSQVLLYAGGIVFAIDILVLATSIFSVSNKFNNFWQNRLGAENV